MFIVKQNGANRLDIELVGKIDKAAMTQALDAMISKSVSIKSGTMLYRIKDFDMPSLGAISVELARLPKLFGLIPKFDKVAVIADANWLRKVSEIKGALFPGMEIKAFESSQEDQAEAWLAS